MVAQDPRSAVRYVIGVLRKVTRIMQLAPFVYLLIYCAILLSESFLPSFVLDWIDVTLFASPAMTAGTLFFSRLLKLCQWHKTACLIPASSQVANFIDGYVITFTQQEVAIINGTILVASVLFLLLSYRHFFDGRKEHSIRNARIL